QRIADVLARRFPCHPSHRHLCKRKDTTAHATTAVTTPSPIDSSTSAQRPNEPPAAEVDAPRHEPRAGEFQPKDVDVFTLEPRLVDDDDQIVVLLFDRDVQLACF